MSSWKSPRVELPEKLLSRRVVFLKLSVARSTNSNEVFGVFIGATDQDKADCRVEDKPSYLLA